MNAINIYQCDAMMTLPQYNYQSRIIKFGLQLIAVVSVSVSHHFRSQTIVAWTFLRDCTFVDGLAAVSPPNHVLRIIARKTRVYYVIIVGKRFEAHFREVSVHCRSWKSHRLFSSLSLYSFVWMWRRFVFRFIVHCADNNYDPISIYRLYTIIHTYSYCAVCTGIPFTYIGTNVRMWYAILWLLLLLLFVCLQRFGFYLLSLIESIHIAQAQGIRYISYKAYERQYNGMAAFLSWNAS